MFTFINFFYNFTPTLKLYIYQDEQLYVWERDIVLFNFVLENDSLQKSIYIWEKDCASTENAEKCV